MSEHFFKISAMPEKTSGSKKGKNRKEDKNLAFFALFALFASTGLSGPDV